MQFQFASQNAGHVNCWNVANAFLWLAVVLVYVLAYLEQLPGAGSPQKVLFENYPTLVTPGSEALYVFPVILIYEGIFIFFQLVPWYRNNKMITLITPAWVAVCLLQIQWVVDLARDGPGYIAYAMACCFGQLAALLAMILVVDSRKPDFWEFWLLRAPFSIHAGWLIICTIVNVNVWVTAIEDDAFSASGKLAVAIVSLAFIFVLAALFGVNTRRPDPLLLIPVAWGAYWIWQSDEGKPVPPALPQDMILAVDVASAHLFSGVCCLGFMALVIRMSMCCVSKKVPEAYERGGILEAGVSVIL